MRINYDDQIEDVIDKFRKALKEMGLKLVVKESGDGFLDYEILQDEEVERCSR